MSELLINCKTEQVNKLLQKLYTITNDLTPVYKEFMKYYREVELKNSFSSRGFRMGKSWGSAYGQKIDLYKTGKLQKIVQGGSGWFQKISKTGVSFGVDLNSVPYARLLQYGHNQKITDKQRGFFWKQFYSSKDDKWKYMALSETLKYPERPYLFRKDKHWQPTAIKKLEEITLNHLFNTEGNNK